MISRRKYLKLMGGTALATSIGVLGGANSAFATRKKGWERMIARAGTTIETRIAGRRVPVADHTWVEMHPAGQHWTHFDCWGGHKAPKRENDGRGHQVKNTHGRWLIANAYRGTKKDITGVTRRDTAHIGIYGVHGVCHQSANCFMKSGQQLLWSKKVRGYAASHAAYGIYGKRYHSLFSNWWLLIWSPVFKAYKNGYTKHADSGLIQLASMDELAQLPSPEVDPLYLAIEGAHNDVLKQPGADTNKLIHHDLTVASFSAHVKHDLPHVDVSRFESEHRAYLMEKEGLAQSGLVQDDMTKRVNDLSRDFQKSLISRLEPADYSTIMGGVAHGDTVEIIDPNLISAVGMELVD